MSIESTYLSMFNNTNDSILPNNKKESNINNNPIDQILKEILIHIKYIIPAFMNQIEQKQFIFYTTQNPNIFNIQIIDPIKYKFKLYFYNKEYDFQCIPDDISNQLKEMNKLKADISFYGGSISSPNKTKVYNIFVKEVEFKKSFIKQQQLIMNMNNKIQEIKPHEENMNDVLLQYMKEIII